ncbi:MAG TPA: multidrug efflux SMR transporter [Planctomycetota bacterium]|jgi:small multidrug resistance pump|nr:multidrug efflux SMR transporter [Planctomycetota bacterium]OQC21894.1 MAG: Quaternary ammonium compound-resistance protein SugE [Planctomycetes bacterium ADurb.Bin069]NMD35878.1 multidrug efflux SMR transporter [Planctomycetota bacterium]HOE29579.1 multidrug efflux SMR transporter [Planctomycetota bacterium]HOE86224.1 multidrug efflux SMR transporter [Planctomycetota bacterium]
MPWLILVLAIVLEVCGTTCLRCSQGLTRLGLSLAAGAFYLASVAALALVLKQIEVGVAYAIWSGVGTALIALIGIALFKEGAPPVKLLGVGLVIAGVALLNLYGGAR